MTDLIACHGCGAEVEDLPGKPHPYFGASAGCWEVYCKILAKEYGEYGYPEPAHQLTVDTYAVEHPGQPERRSIQSVNGHLASLCLALERGIEGREATRTMGRILAREKHLEWLEPPSFEGRMTVLDVVDAGSREEHCDRVGRWARDVWEAWSPHQARVREMVEGYLDR
ncbi:MAG TPA: DUF5946 family protein [Thermoanaerobaculia bacterium]|nr:DUF5946 family protein [Thermoanaerobaculia bacterium]